MGIVNCFYTFIGFIKFLDDLIKGIYFDSGFTISKFPKVCMVTGFSTIFLIIRGDILFFPTLVGDGSLNDEPMFFLL